MQCEIGSETFEVEIIRKKNKNIYMKWKNIQTLTITCNHFITKIELKKIIQKNQKTLQKMLIQKRNEIEKEQFFYYLGKPYEILYDSNSKAPTFYQNKIVVKDEKTLTRFYNEECKRIFQSELKRILPYFKSIPPFELKLRKMKTRWGVNNFSSHTITLNTELLKKDLDLLDYVIIHELCHFYEANHSENFWRHVEEYYPKYKDARKRLRYQ